MEKCFFTGPLYNLKDDKEFIKTEPLEISKIKAKKHFAKTAKKIDGTKPPVIVLKRLVETV
jgi:hypothetical protein